MAGNTYKKSTNSSKKKTGSKFKKINFLKDNRFRYSFGIFLIISAVCLFIAFTSYLFTGKSDQDIIKSLSDESLVQSGRQIENWLGLFGARLADRFIFEWFGIGAFLIVPILFLYGIKVLTGWEFKYFKKVIVASIFSVFWVSLALGYAVLGNENESNFVYLCGGIGYEFADTLNSLSGWGTFFLLVFSLAVFVIFFFDVDKLIRTKHDFGESDIEDEEIQDPYINVVQEENEELYTEADELLKDEEEVPQDTALELNTEVNTAKEETPDEEELELEVAHEAKENTTPPKEEESEEVGLIVEEQKEEALVDVGKYGHYDPTLDLASYKYPGIDIMEDRAGSKVQVTREELEANKDRIVDTLGNYKIGISSIKATIGPTVTLYEIVPEAGVKISKIKNLEDDIALSLAALGIRIIAPIPGKGTIGIEVPNKNRETVSMRSVLASEKFQKSDAALPVVFGKTISNDPFVIDLAKMPHILMAGATGQGKSVGLNVILTSLLYKKHPSQLKFVLVDPKKVELSIFSKIERHFLAKLPDAEEAIITDTKKVINTLNSLCIEMDQRYDLLKDAGCRNLKEYNKKFVERKLNPNNGHRFMPYIVLVIDELADLMMTAGKEVETPIARLAQLARAIGIHLIVATQRPSVNVITGIIKANFPARISFKVTSKVDSRTILDAGGADQLIGMGDMLFSQGSEMIRLQCAFVDTPEVDGMVDFIGEQRGYESAFLLPEYIDESGGGNGDVDLADRDAMFDEAARVIVSHQQGSTSLLQRKLKLGYNRAGRLIDQLEAAGIVGPFEGSKAREVLVPDEYSLEQLLNDINSNN